ncbi:MAG: alpha/beta fold hydrolase, partial [Dehalococcoidia bacterium]|nr:alpha/beta fold hydrolase [Dehalococcoidia bacterium]
VAYRQYAYDVTLTEGHSKAMRTSLSAITGLGGQKSIFTDDELRSITAPTLAIWGENDPLFPVEHGYRLAELVPNARMFVIENAMHVPLLDRADEVNELFDGFLTDR